MKVKLIQPMKVKLILMLACGLGGGWSAVAQLAITETLSSASTNNTFGATQGPDFWELSNFGTNTLDLTGYKWNDNAGGLAGADASPFNGLTIEAGEVVLFAEDDIAPVSTPEQFRAWWGLPPTQKVVFYNGNGQSADGDSVILWGPDATTDAEYLDRVDFGVAARGRTFIYHPTNGIHGIYSTNGVSGAFVAAQSDDVGSPGVNSGPVALFFTRQPTNTTGYLGFPVTLSAAAHGLPRPYYQWRYEGDPLPGETGASFTLASAQAGDAGNYSVVISNGLETLTSTNAYLTVDASPAAPTFITQPTNLDAYIGQTVTLTATAQGNPAPSYVWRSNGVAIAGQTGNQLVLSPVETNFTATYTVVIYNVVGTNSAAAAVTVTPKPRFLLTEVHSTGSTDFQDWWELTSFDSRPFNLKGYRFDDDSQSLGVALTITNDLVIHPGESVIFVETTAGKPMTPAGFRAWWGSNNVPASVKIAVYAGSGIGFGGGGDGLYLWNVAATANGDFICAVTFGSSPASPRRAFVYQPDNPGAQTPFAGSLTLMATNGVNGAFVASNADVGSPGRVIEPVLVNVAGNGGAELSWNSVAGRAYTVESKDTVTAADWTTRSNLVAVGDTTAIAQPTVGSHRLYRVGTTLPYPTP